MSPNARVSTEPVKLTPTTSFGHHMTVVMVATLASLDNKLPMCVESNLLPATTERIWRELHRESHVNALRWTMNAILATLELDKEDLALKKPKTSLRSKEMPSY